MPDYYADPLWDASNESMVSVDRLPVTHELQAELRSWGRPWGAVAQDEPDSSDQRLATLGQEATGLCDRLRAELGSGWRVGLVTFRGSRQFVQWQSDTAPVLFPPGAGR